MRSSKLVKDFQKLIIFNKVSYVLNKILTVICFYTVSIIQHLFSIIIQNSEKWNQWKVF